MQKSKFQHHKQPKNRLHEKLKTARGRDTSSQRWLNRQINDSYVRLAQDLKVRSRAYFKLSEIDERYQLFNAEQLCVLDLGAAPGSWSQYVAKRLGNAGKIIAMDLKEITPITGVSTLVGDFSEASVQAALINLINRKPDIILSDIAPNFCGIKNIDVLRTEQLCEEVIIFAKQNLIKGGSLVMKVLGGGTPSDLLSDVKKNFGKVSHFKPKSSRKESSEMYLIAQNYIDSYKESD